MNIFALLIIAQCRQTSNTDRWNSFLNYGLKKHVNDSYFVNVAFKNNAEYPVNIYKTSYNTNSLNPAGVVEATLSIGQSIKLPCLVGDTFTAKVNSPASPYNDLLLMAYDVSRVYLRDQTCESAPILKCERKPFTGDMRWTPPDSLMFSSLSEHSLDLYYWDGACEEYVDTIRNQNDFHIMSTLGHSFRIRNSQSQSLLLEYTYEEIVIKGLDENNDYEISEKATQLFDILFLNKLKDNIQIQQKMVEELELKNSYSKKDVCV
jgi:hypothetical protein